MCICLGQQYYRLSCGLSGPKVALHMNVLWSHASEIYIILEQLKPCDDPDAYFACGKGYPFAVSVPIRCRSDSQSVLVVCAKEIQLRV